MGRHNALHFLKNLATKDSYWRGKRQRKVAGFWLSVVGEKLKNGKNTSKSTSDNEQPITNNPLYQNAGIPK
jgi:hypothetical protein